MDVPCQGWQLKNGKSVYSLYFYLYLLNLTWKPINSISDWNYSRNKPLLLPNITFWGILSNILEPSSLTLSTPGLKGEKKMWFSLIFFFLLFLCHSLPAATMILFFQLRLCKGKAIPVACSGRSPSLATQVRGQADGRQRSTGHVHPHPATERALRPTPRQLRWLLPERALSLLSASQGVDWKRQQHQSSPSISSSA